MVFRAVPAPVFRFEKAGSSSCGLGSPSELVVSTSARTSISCSRTSRDSGRLPWGFAPLRDDSSASPPAMSVPAHLRSAHSVSHAHDGFLLAEPCRPVSSCCHVQDSRFRGFLPRSSRTTSSVPRPSSPLAALACRRLPDDASSRRVDLEVFTGPRSATSVRVLAPANVRVPSCDLLLRASFRQPRKRGQRFLRSGFDGRCCVCPGRWPSAYLD